MSVALAREAGRLPTVHAKEEFLQFREAIPYVRRERAMQLIPCHAKLDY
jgi:hypothetical protein